MQCKSRWTLVVYFKWNKELVEENLLVNTNNIHYMSWNKTHGHVLSFCNTFCTYIYIYLKLTRYNYIKLVFVTSLFKWLKYCAYLMPPSLIYIYTYAGRTNSRFPGDLDWGQRSLKGHTLWMMWKLLGQ